MNPNKKFKKREIIINKSRIFRNIQAGFEIVDGVQHDMLM